MGSTNTNLTGGQTGSLTRTLLVPLAVPLLIGAALVSCQTSQSTPITPTSWVVPPGFDMETYPAPLPVAEGVNIFSQGCPNPAGMKKGELDLDTALEVLNTLGSEDLDAKRRVADPSFWPLLSSVGRWEPLSRDRVEVRPGSTSPHGDLLANGCGKQTLELTSWAKACPGPCKESEGMSPSLIGHFFLILRKGHWLVWAAE